MHVEGDLCLDCQWLVRTVHHGDPAAVPVERIAFGEAAEPHWHVHRQRSGFGGPGAPGGRCAAAGVTGSLWAHHSFRLDGAIEQGNRGPVDRVDVFKMDERFLDVLLTVSQERTVQASGPGLLHVDAALIAESSRADILRAVVTVLGADRDVITLCMPQCGTRPTDVSRGPAGPSGDGGGPRLAGARDLLPLLR